MGVNKRCQLTNPAPVMYSNMARQQTPMNEERPAPTQNKGLLSSPKKDDKRA